MLRLAFLLYYAGGILVLLVRVLPAGARAARAGTRPDGIARYLHLVLLPIGFLVPPAVMLLRAGEVAGAWTAVRVAGVASGLYAAAILPWSAATLGRFLVPQAVVAPDHELVTSGPCRFVRHPAYSGDLALWLGAALATVNVVLLALWPLYALGVLVETRVEESLLDARFGAAYRAYQRRVGRLAPRLSTFRP